MTRIVSWFSCGAASAIATKLAIENRPQGLEADIVYCEVIEEHPDNARFLRECEQWFGQPITILRDEKYNGSIYEVFERERYLVGPGGAACTKLLKKQVRQKFQRPTDIQVFGFTVEEQERYDRLLDANNEVRGWPVLIDQGLSKSDCLALLKRAGIALPTMYGLGYRNNNCVGCVKGQAGYWNKIRIDFPAVFERMAVTEERLGRTVCKIERIIDGKRTLERVPLRELPPDAGEYPREPSIECSIFCLMAEKTYGGI